MSDNRVVKVSVDEVAVNRRRGGAIRVLLSPKMVGSTSGLFGVATLEPGEHISEHRHPYSEEFVYVVRGLVMVRLDGERVLATGPDEAVMVPKDLRHRLENHGTVQALVVFSLSPLAPRPDLGHIDTEPFPEAADQRVETTR